MGARRLLLSALLLASLLAGSPPPTAAAQQTPAHPPSATVSTRYSYGTLWVDGVPHRYTDITTTWTWFVMVQGNGFTYRAPQRSSQTRRVFWDRQGAQPRGAKADSSGRGADGGAAADSTTSSTRATP